MADLSISFKREQVVDFSMPFLDLGKRHIICSFKHDLTVRI